MDTPYQERFADVGEHDGFDVSDDATDREVFYSLWVQLETGDWPTDEIWALLRERYPEEPRFALLHFASLAVQGISVTGLADFEAPVALTELAEATQALARREPGTEADDQPFELVFGWMYKTLDEGERRTRGGGSWGPRQPSAGPVDYASVLASSRGPEVPYSPRGRFVAGQQIGHKRFGLGVVVGVEPDRLRVFFPDGEKSLVAFR